MKRIFFASLLTVLAFGQTKDARVQIALLLDTSNSMDGLIHQAKTQLWTIVNDLATARRHGVAPTLEVALFEYGNSGLSSQQGYVRQVLALTTDLDRVSEALHQLSTNGGEEYCGVVIADAVQKLAWSTQPGSYKAIFIAGNEPFNQGSYDFRAACKASIAKGIVVNTIHCGPFQEGVQGFWKEGADLADGQYACIDQDRTDVAIATPFDDRILQLNTELNQTYLAYGAAGEASQKRQRAQDRTAAAEAPAAAVQRSVSKATSLYKNEDWDLVDAVASGDVEVETMEEEALPEPLQGLSAEERKAAVDKASADRTRIQAELAEVAKQREAFIKQNQPEVTDSLEAKLREAIRQQLRTKQYQFNQ
ncbi:MAG: VWA domain-containing protein [Acidobacteria bacterium]|nr:VWA domain-containing protein [Acidobacteriota bacterium]